MTAAREKALIAVVAQVVVATTFVGMGHLTAARDATPPAWLVTSLDRALPLVPLAVWPYVSWYALPVLFFRGDRPEFRRATVAALLAFVLCVLGYLLVPVAIRRPPIAADGVSAGLLDLVYAVDPPVNVFPSFHAALAGVVLGLRAVSPRWRPGLALWMTAICVSCVLTKQHYALDVVAGLAVGLLSDRIATARATVRYPRAGLPPIAEREEPRLTLRLRAHPAPSRTRR
jgi:membrane-associated phospholipid phosphatase